MRKYLYKTGLQTRLWGMLLIIINMEGTTHVRGANTGQVALSSVIQAEKATESKISSSSPHSFCLKVPSSEFLSWLPFIIDLQAVR